MKDPTFNKDYEEVSQAMRDALAESLKNHQKAKASSKKPTTKNPSKQST